MTANIQAAISRAQFPEKLAPLFVPKRYKILYGGRGGAKSWGIARALLLLAANKKLRILCVRELQKSIQDSVHKLLSDQIDKLGLSSIYTIEKARIYCNLTGSEFSFEGIRHNAKRVKSYEGIDICWVEEANNVTKDSWNIVIPTIRKEGSEIWISFNPELETDDTYKRFVLTPPGDSAVIEINWRDNPWFNDVLNRERLDLLKNDPDEYLNVYEGKCKTVLTGAVYAKQLRQMEFDNRITRVPYERLAPVDVFFDLGRADATSMWFGQYAAMEYRLIDFYENSGEHIDHYIQHLQTRGYTYGTIWLPHDARAKTIGTKRSVEEQVRNFYPVRIVPKLSIEDGINAVRTLFPNLWIDKENCADGVQHLRHYCYEVSQKEGEKGRLSSEPKHDEHSHAADALRSFGVAMRAPKKKRTMEEADESGTMVRVQKQIRQLQVAKLGPLGWMR